jgi:hypothetical protein
MWEPEHRTKRRSAMVCVMCFRDPPSVGAIFRCSARTHPPDRDRGRPARRDRPRPCAADQLGLRLQHNEDCIQRRTARLLAFLASFCQLVVSLIIAISPPVGAGAATSRNFAATAWRRRPTAIPAERSTAIIRWSNRSVGRRPNGRRGTRLCRRTGREPVRSGQ